VTVRVSPSRIVGHTPQPKFALAFGLMIVLSGFVGMGAASAASAGEYCHAPRVHCGYKTVAIYVEKEIAYRTKVVR
jgi:hypothetical protein